MIDPLAAIVSLLAIPVVLLAAHIFRDVRGGRRNREQRCYACGASGRLLLPVFHNKGDIYLYCKKCDQRHGALSGLFTAACCVAFVAFAVVMLLAAFSR